MMRFFLPSTIGATLVAFSTNSFTVSAGIATSVEDDVELLKVYKNFFSQEDIDLAIQNQKERTDDYKLEYSDEVTFKATIMPAFHTKRMLDLMGVQPNSPIQDRYVYIKEIYADTAMHVDDTYDDDTLQLTDTGDNDVGFIFAETNPDASFVYYHGSDDTGFVQEVPVKQGDLVVFKGNRIHHTKINSGTVKLVGPFMASSNNKIALGGRERALEQKEEATDDPNKEASEFHERSLGGYYSHGRPRALRHWVDRELHLPANAHEQEMAADDEANEHESRTLGGYSHAYRH